MDQVVRKLEHATAVALSDTPVVVLQGARQVGKSTLASEILRARGKTMVSLDDAEARDAARRDPTGYLEALCRNETIVGIDEVQRAPGLILAIKASVDRDRRPGRFLLTGSSDVLNAAGVQDSLAGRAETIELEGFAQSELHPSSHPFIDRVLQGALSVSMQSKLVRSDYLELACLGGYPEVAHRLPQRRGAWFREYAKRLTRRDLKESHIRRDDLFEPLLRMCAARTASELNVSAIASDMQAPTSTTPALLDHLESMFLIKRLPAWSKNLSERVIRRPKLLMTDSGFAASLAHLNAESMSITRNLDAAGAILETFVLGELRRQNGWSSQRVDFFHYRDREGREIDLIADLGDGRVVAIEVKASSTPTASDTKHLRWLSDRLGEGNFVAGILLHTGPRAVPFATNIFALPIEVLWT